MRSAWPSILLYSAACGTLFVGAAQLGLGIAFLFLPSLPLLMLGLSRPASQLLYAIALSALFIGAFSGFSTAVFFIACLAIPITLFAPRALLQDQAGNWFPIGLLMTDIALYTALIFLSLELHLLEQGGIREVIAANLKESLSNADATTQAMLVDFSRQNPFLMLGVGAWWWMLLLYAHAIMANWLLKQKHKQIRSHLSLEKFSLPVWALAVLVAVCMGSFMGGEIRFICRTLLIIFLLPYYLLGVSYAASHIRNWPNGKFWVVALYLASLLYVAPVLALAGVGVWKQCKALMRRE